MMILNDTYRIFLLSIKSLTYLWALGFIGTAVSAQNQPSHSYLSAAEKKSTIKNLALEYVKNRIGTNGSQTHHLSIAPVDPRLIIPNCPAGFQASMPSDIAIQSNNKVRISCLDEGQARPWSTYIRIRYQELFPTLVVKRNVSIGETLTPDHIELKYMQKVRLKMNHFSDPKSLNGVRLKRRLVKGQQVVSKHICVVCKGDMVTIQAKNERFNLQTLGRAISDGNMGESIKVKNTRSQKVIHAIVTQVGMVKVSG